MLKSFLNSSPTDNKICFATCAVIGAATLLCLKLTERRHKITRNEIKFVIAENKKCKAHVFSQINCMKGLSGVNRPTFICSYEVLKWMIEFLDSATESLDITTYLVTCVEFKDAILRAHKERGVKVRVITDLTMSKGSGSAIPDFIKEGIPVRMHDTLHMMHRKSAVADRKVVLMGTGNWTMQALAGNSDSWLLTTDPKIADGFVDGFEKHWADDVLIEPTLEEFNMIEIHK